MYINYSTVNNMNEGGVGGVNYWYINWTFLPTPSVLDILRDHQVRRSQISYWSGSYCVFGTWESLITN